MIQWILKLFTRKSNLEKLISKAEIKILFKVSYIIMCSVICSIILQLIYINYKDAFILSYIIEVPIFIFYTLKYMDILEQKIFKP